MQEIRRAFGSKQELGIECNKILNAYKNTKQENDLEYDYSHKDSNFNSNEKYSVDSNIKQRAKILKSRKLISQKNPS